MKIRAVDLLFKSEFWGDRRAKNNGLIYFLSFGLDLLSKFKITV